MANALIGFTGFVGGTLLRQTQFEALYRSTNIKEIELLDAGNDFIRKKAKANFKTLGKKLGAKMKWAANEIEKFEL